MSMDPREGVDGVDYCNGVWVLGGEVVVEAYGETAVFCTIARGVGVWITRV